MSNSVVTLSSFNILFITQVLTVLTSTIKYNEYVTDKGENISIPCIADGNIMWVKENGSNNSTIIQTGKYLVLTNVSASDRGLYVCFAAVTSSSKSLDYDGDQNDNNSTSLDLNDKNEREQNDDDDEDEIKNKQVLLTSTTTTTTNTQKHVNDTKTTTNTFIKPLIENNKNIKSQTETETQNASTTSMLPMPNVTITTATATTTPKSTILSDTASASATKTTTTTTTIVIKTLSTNKTTTTTILGHDHPNAINNTYLSLSSNNSNRSNSNTISSSSSGSDNNLTTLKPLSPSTSTAIDDIEEQEFQAFQKINLTVRTPPGPVTKLYFKASTILGFLVWRFNKTNSGGYPVRSFTAEFRNVSYVKPPFNSSFEHKWSRMDPINIAPNVRQMEVYRLEPNTTYEFRIWANNQLGSGEVVTTNVTTLPETKEEDLIRLIQPDLDNFDPRIWIVAVSIVLGTFVILAIGLCIVLTKECYQSSQAGTETNSICINNQNNNQKITYFNNRNDEMSSDISNNIVIVVGDDVADSANDHSSDKKHRQQHHQIVVDVVDA